MHLKPTIEKIRTLCTGDSFDRGVRYFKEGRVQKINLSSGILNAKVIGTKTYEVTIDIDNDFSSSCTCPYDFDGYCKHIIAVLLDLNENYSGITKRGKTMSGRVGSALNSMDAENLRTFLKKEFIRNKPVQSHFLLYIDAEEGVEKSIRDYKQEMDILKDSALEEGYLFHRNKVDFYVFMDLAARHKEMGKVTEAAKVYQALSELMASNMGVVDDTDDYYIDRFWEALEDLIVCINLMERESKFIYIDYFFERFIEKDPIYLQDEYVEALKSVCITIDSLDHLKKLLSPRLPKSLPDRKKNWDGYYDSKVLLDMQAFVLDGLRKLSIQENK